MQCWVYKGRRKANTYLYVTVEDDFSQVPEAILELMGPLSLVLDIDLSTRSRLARVSSDEVRQNLMKQGFFIQLPPGEYSDPFGPNPLDQASPDLGLSP